jgi:AbrB family looped-hinge helix DNA binding protein
MEEQIASTRMSSRGQVVIPEEIRKRLKLSPGDKFLVFGSQGTVVLKMLTQPSKEEIRSLMKRIRTEARKGGLRKSDIADAVKESRKK